MQSKINEILDRFAKTYKKIDLSLERLREFLVEIGNPHQNLPPVIHVAGTNGKGSTIAFLKSILETSGKRCHVYTSPHLVSFNERIQVAGKSISDDFLYDLLKQVDEASQGKDLTFFEKTTAVAFLAFSQIPADYLLLETGLGGRLDATNIVSKKILTIITPISLDHTELLGDTLELIAAEKAGIMARSVPCLSAFQDPVVMKILDAKAEEKNCDIKYAGVITDLPNLALKGEFQKQNASLAVFAASKLGIDKATCLRGIQYAKWPARMQHIKDGKYLELLPDTYELWLDGGHNPAAAEKIVKSLKPDIIIIGMLNTKDAKEFIKHFSGKVKALCAVPIEGEELSYKPEELAKISANLGINSFFAENIEDALTNIVINFSGNLKILICGSLYLAGNFLEKNNEH